MVGSNSITIQQYNNPEMPMNASASARYRGMRLLPLAIVLGGIIVASASAQEPALIPESGKIFGDASCDFTTGEFGFHCFPLYTAYLIQVLFAMTGGFFLTQLLFAGYQIAFGPVTGDKEKGKERIKAAILGISICVLAFLIVDFIASALLLPV